MKILILNLVLLTTSLAWAQKAHVTLIDPKIDGKSLEKDFHVHKGSTHKSSLPDRVARNKVLDPVPSTKKWDELKKDIFFMDLKKKSLSDLKKKYPEVSLQELKSLKERR